MIATVAAVRIRWRVGGYTLVEMLVALAVGMAVMQIAFASFFFIQKFVRQIERIEGLNQVAQAAVLWTIGKPALATDFPLGEQVSRVGVPKPPAIGIVTAHGRVQYLLRDHELYTYPKPGRGCDTQLLIPLPDNP